MQYTVVFTPEAQEQLAKLYRYIAAAASPEIAERYTSAIVTYCQSLQTFPHRGKRRDDIRPGLRITNYKKRTVIAFDVEGERVRSLACSTAGRTTKLFWSPIRMSKSRRWRHGDKPSVRGEKSVRLPVS